HVADYIPEENLVRLDNSIEFPVYAILFYWMAWSPDNRFLAASWRDDGEQKIVIWEIATETVIFSDNNGTVFAHDYLWSADSHYLSYGISNSDYSEQTIYFIPVLAQEALEPIIIHSNINTHLIWSYDGQYLLVANRSMDFYAMPSQELV